MTTLLEKLLTLKIIFLASILLVAYETWYLNILDPDNGLFPPALLSAIPLLFPLVKFEFVWGLCTGHGTTHQRRKLARFPIVALVVLTLLIFLSLGGIKLSSTMESIGFSPASTANSFIFYLNLLIATTATAARWYFILYYRYFAGSMVDLLQYFDFHEVWGAERERMIRYCKQEGFVNTDTAVPNEALQQ